MWTQQQHYLSLFNDTATTGIYTDNDTLSLHDALPISSPKSKTDYKGAITTN
jgi:hypothetical protein